MRHSEESDTIARNAITDLIRSHRDHVYRLTFSTCRLRAAEDLAQEALTRAISKLPGFRGQSSFRTWLARIAANISIDHLRRKRSVVELDADWHPESPDRRKW